MHLEAIVIAALAGSATAAVNMPSTANIYGAGHAVAPGPGGNGGGSLPPMVAVPSGAVSFTLADVTGQVLYRSGLPWNDADGTTSTCLDRPDWDGLAGPHNLPAGRFLTAVFLDNTEPADPPPVGLDHGNTIAFAGLSPGLRQLFFTGDGFTGNGAGNVQVFDVPQGATRLYFGLIDGFGCADPPGWYSDNSGSLSFTVHFQLACAADVTTTGAGVGDPGFGVPDGQVTGADIQYYVNLWVANDPGADVTTTGAGAGDPSFGVPDGTITGADIQYYVNLWVAGCP